MTRGERGAAATVTDVRTACTFVESVTAAHRRQVVIEAIVRLVRDRPDRASDRDTLTVTKEVT
jgi:hypothetical protein